MQLALAITERYATRFSEAAQAASIDEDLALLD